MRINYKTCIHVCSLFNRQIKQYQRYRLKQPNQFPLVKSSILRTFLFLSSFLDLFLRSVRLFFFRHSNFLCWKFAISSLMCFLQINILILLSFFAVLLFKFPFPLLVRIHLQPANKWIIINNKSEWKDIKISKYLNQKRIFPKKKNMNFTLESTIMTKHVKNRDIGRIVQVPFLCKHLLVYINHILNIANYGFVILFDI